MKAELWTNANHNDSSEKYDALPMSKVRTRGDLVTYRVQVPISKVGNYRASARLTENGNVHWASQAGLADVRFRPHVEAHDALNMMELNVSNVNGGKGTLADLTGTGSPTTNGKYTLEFLKSQGINSVWASIRELLSNPYFSNRELMNLTSHDEERWKFGGDMKNAQRMYSLLPLLGGANMFVAGDEFGESQGLAFKQSKAVGALKDPSAAGLAISEHLRRAGVAKSALAALQDDNRAFLDQKAGGADGELLALARNADPGKKGNPVVVVANFNNSRARENAFSLDEETRRRIDPNKQYQVRDLMADDPKAPLWNQPLTGQELLDSGLFTRLSPYQVQALELFRFRERMPLAGAANT